MSANPAVDWTEILGLREAEETTGLRYKHLTELIAAGKLPAFTIAGGKKYYVRRGDLDALLTPVR